MTPARESRALRRLAGAVTVMRDGPDSWAAFPDGDRRRRPVLRLKEEDVRALTASGALSDGPARRLTEAGRARLERLRIMQDGGQDSGVDPYAAQHQDLAAAPSAAGGAAYANLAESPLARLTRATRPGDPAALSAIEAQAGERLRADLARSTYNARVTMDWSAPPLAKGAARAGARDPAGAADSALAARESVNAALSFVGPTFAAALMDLLWRELGMEAIERRQNWPRRSGRLGIKLALARLAEHYGYGVL